MRKITSCFAISLSIFAMACSLTACSNKTIDPPVAQPRIEGNQIIFSENSKQQEALTTEITHLQTEENIKIYGRAILDEHHTAQVYSPFNGRIERLLVSLGEKVQKGQALARISSPELGLIKAELSKTQADFSQAKQNAQRTSLLFEQGLIAKKDLEIAQTELSKARAEYQRNQAKAQAYAASGQVDQTGILFAPIYGEVVDMNIHVGTEIRAENNQGNQWAQSTQSNGSALNTALFTIGNTKNLIALLEVPEIQAHRIKPGQKIRIWGNQQENNPINSTVNFIQEIVDPQTRTVKIRADIQNIQRQLRAEQFINATVQVPSQPGLLVNASSVLLSPEGAIAYVKVKQNTFERRSITIQEAGIQTTRILSGVAPGQEIVKDGALHLEQLFKEVQKK